MHIARYKSSKEYCRYNTRIAGAPFSQIWLPVRSITICAFLVSFGMYTTTYNNERAIAKKVISGPPLINLLTHGDTSLRGAIFLSCACSLLICTTTCTCLTTQIAATAARISGARTTKATIRMPARYQNTVFVASCHCFAKRDAQQTRGTHHHAYLA